MPDVIDDPILNRPFEEPARHFRFDEDGITSQVVETRRPSSYFVPIPASRKRAGQASFDEYTKDRAEENHFVNQVRGRVRRWRELGCPGVTATTRWLLDYWSDPGRERPLFFCQLEAVETAVYLAEAADKLGDAWIADALRKASDDANPGLYRLGHKMATGSGKTVVMAMLIAWQALNRFANPRDRRFTDAFLVVTPGITIRDRLRVLLPASPDNYYRERDLLPPQQLAELGRARIAITNFHAFQRKETRSVPRLNKRVLGRQDRGPFTETPDQMVRRVCRDLGKRRNIVVLNDEAHHCYQPRADDGDEPGGGSADERREARQRQAEARVWASGLRAVHDKLGVRTAYDLSATPFFLRGSGYPEGTLFPWVVSDFSLIDAIESGIVKIPRVPVSDDAGAGALPTYRDLWARIRDDLPRKGRKTGAVTGEPRLPAELQGALHSLYGDYLSYHRRWRDDEAAQAAGSPPPVFIVVCNNTNVSKLVFDYVAGWERALPDGSTRLVPGELELFSNARDGAWSDSPSTILVDSSQLESGEAMSAEFKRFAAVQIEEFKADLRARFPGRDADDVTDEDLLREVMNTVGKPGKLGEQVTCVVSVSMLTEGWDANTVTHILGVRAFGTQLLSEQVIGRGLRRRSYTVAPDGRFEPEYAEVYGVPFSFIPTSATPAQPPPPGTVTWVRAVPERARAEIGFPKVAGYRYELGGQRLDARFDEDARLTLSARDTPTRTEMAPIVGLKGVHNLQDLRRARVQSIAFVLAQHLLDRYVRDASGDRPWLFPQVLSIVRRWLGECVECKDDTFVQLLALHERRDDAVDRIYRAIVATSRGGRRVTPILKPFDPLGSTRWVVSEPCATLTSNAKKSTPRSGATASRLTATLLSSCAASRESDGRSSSVW
ncbi:DEAD/DEAH box helicase family protein [soil metagenome]